MEKKASSDEFPDQYTSNGNVFPGDVDTSQSKLIQSQRKKKRKNTRADCLIKNTESVQEMTLLQRFTMNKYYEIASGALIIINAIVLGWQTQWMAENGKDKAARDLDPGEQPWIWYVMAFFFCIAFTFELGLRWVAQGFCEFFGTAEVWWNVLDVFVVFSSILECLMDIIYLAAGLNRTSGLQNISVIRVLRVVRIVRVARVIRIMRFFRELRIMIYSILGCMKNLLWVVVVLCLTFYIFGVAFTSAVTDKLKTAKEYNAEENEKLLLYFGTVDRAALSLFMSMSGGNDWAEYYEQLNQLSIWYRCFYLMFILFTVYAVVNIVTGVFVESALQSNIKDKDIIVHEELEAKKIYLQSMEEIFNEMDEDGRGTISYTEFSEKLKDENVIFYFNRLKLDVADAKSLFQLLDYSCDGEIGIDEFLDGCYRLQGESRNLDMKIMQYEVRYLKARFEDLHAIVEAIDTNTKTKGKERATDKPRTR
jgi:hypothetical protein